jgi:hypothetical protein
MDDIDDESENEDEYKESRREEDNREEIENRLSTTEEAEIRVMEERSEPVAVTSVTEILTTEIEELNSI